MLFILKVPPRFQGCFLGQPSRFLIPLLTVPNLRASDGPHSTWS